MVYHLCVENYPSPDMCLARDRIAIALPFCIAMFRRCCRILQVLSTIADEMNGLNIEEHHLVVPGDLKM